MVELTITIDIPEALHEKIEELMPNMEDRVNFILSTFKQKIIAMELEQIKQELENQKEETLIQKAQELAELYG